MAAPDILEAAMAFTFLCAIALLVGVVLHREQ